MKDSLDQQLSSFRQECGDRELVAFLERRKPPDKAVFIQRLYSDIHVALDDLQGQAHELINEGERKLRSRLLIVLRTYGYRAAGEADHRGHTDLLVESSHLRLKWIGEAKKYDGSGYAHLSKGIRQLHTRYSSGTHRDSGFIVFVFSRNAAGVIERWKTEIEKGTLCGLEKTPYDDTEIPLCFWTNHLHEGSGLPVRTKHIFATLYYQPKDYEPESS